MCALCSGKALGQVVDFSLRWGRSRDNTAVRSDNLDFHVPPELVAQHAIEPRDAARLLVVGEEPGSRSDHRVSDLPQLLRPGDLLVVNTTKVFPARLLGHKDSGGQIEVLLIHPSDEPACGAACWSCLVRGRVRPGMTLHLAGGVSATVQRCDDDSTRILAFPEHLDMVAHAQQHGHIPLPPYIRRDDEAADHQRYQSVFAETPGSVAAPTASLHFTDDLLATLAAQGVNRADVELRVGPGTFKPVTSETIEEHPIHREWCTCPPSTVDAIAACRAGGGRVIAVGTTVVRTLQSAGADGILRPWSGWTDCFLYPPQVVHHCDYLLTNFHLPRSTLLALVACFIGYDDLLSHYHHAITSRYRLFSYGDAMLVPNRRLLAPQAMPETM